MTFAKNKINFCLKEKCQLMAGQVNKHIAWTFFLFLCLEDNLKISLRTKQKRLTGKGNENGC